MAANDHEYKKSKGQLLPDIYLIGAGVQMPIHLTIEALDAMDYCQEIYTILSPSVLALLPSEFASKIKSLWPFYQPGILRRDAYAAEVVAILEAAERNRPVAYLTVGNPVFFDNVTQGLLKAGQERGLDVRIVAGISSIDTILVDLQHDIAPGLQIYDATALVAYAIQPRVDMACLLLQPNVFGTAYVAAGYQPQQSMIAILRDYLLRFYPPEHQIIYITSATHWKAVAQLECFALQTLGGTQQAPQTPGASLFLPPIHEAVADLAFTARMADVQSFAEGYHRQFPISDENGGQR
jgi:uncharacterized protein YabN with tetrapyrrole methylase and pyrophosphatase domain